MLPFSVTFTERITIKYVSAGSRHSIALSGNGEVFTWGWGVQGQLGLGDFISVSTPTKINPFSPTSIIFISAGGMHSGCIDAQGFCYTWGSAQYGQLGQGEEATKSMKTCLPNRVTIDDGDESPLLVKWLSCGGMHSAAVDINGDVWCWGRSDSGQTGCNAWIYSFVPFVSRPSKLPPFESPALSVRCGGFHTMIVTEGGRVYSMGKEEFGMLGVSMLDQKSDSKMDSLSSRPRLITSLLEHHVVGVSCGGWHSLFWTRDGELFSCGKGEYGRLGLGNEESPSTPQLVNLGDGIKVHTASAGGSHSLIISTTGVLYVVGRSDDGRLGLLNITPAIHKVLAITELKIGCDRVVKYASAGGSHSLIVTE